MRVINGQLVAAVLPETKAGAVKPVHELRPRDRMGKVVEIGGSVALGSGGQGTVLENAGGGRVRVRKADGTEVVIDAGETTLIRGAAANAQRATGPDGLQAALDADPGALPPPGDRADAAAETDAQAAIDRPVGGEPAPDADPAGAATMLATPTGDQIAWLRTDEGDIPVGYLRTDANDPASTLRFADGQAWAAAVDAVGMAATSDGQTPTGPTAPTPGGFQTDPNLPPATPPPPVTPPQESDLPAASYAPSREAGGPATLSPENLSTFLLDGLDQAPDAVAQAKAESIAGIVARMADIDDDVVLHTEDADRLGRLESGQVVLLRLPKPGGQPSPAPTMGEQLTQWVYREIDQVRFEALLRSGNPPPPELEVVTADQWRTWSRAARVAEALALWAAGSGGANPDALALQEAAADLFGMDGYAPAPALRETPELRQRVEDALEENRPFYEALLLAMYQATQDRFREQQVIELELFRGWRTPDGTPEWAVEDTTDELPVRPLSAWSANAQLAGGYARGPMGDQLGYVTSGVFPVERILGTARTGFGSLRAGEFVVLAGPGNVAVHEATEADGPPVGAAWAPPTEDERTLTHGGFDPTDPTVVAPGMLSSEEELTAAIAGAQDDGRRLALMHRAATMGLSRLLPEDWQPDGSVRQVDLPDGAARGEDGLLVPLDDTQYASHQAAVEDAISRAKAAGLETVVTESLDGDGEVWPAERIAAHVELVDAVRATAVNVPNEGKALLLGGLPGADFRAVLGTPRAGIDPTQYLTISLADIKEIMAGRDLTPEVPDAGVELSPMERVPLVHDEAVFLAELIAGQAYAERKNICWELGMVDGGTLEALTGKLREVGYGEVQALFVDIPVETSVQRTDADYRTGLEDYRNGEGPGGRYWPAPTLRTFLSTEFTSAPRVNFEAARDSFDDWQVWDDSVDGRAPELVYYKDAPSLEQLTEAARTGSTAETKGLPGTKAALSALRRRHRLPAREGWGR